MIEQLPPGLLLIAGGFAAPLLRGRLRQAFLVLVPILGLLQLWRLPDGLQLQLQLFDYVLTPVRNDPLSMVFGLIFHLAAVVMVVYAMHEDDPLQVGAGLVYAGTAIGAVFAGDLLTLFVYWEATAISSVFLIWARRSRRAYRAGMRYLIIQVASGVLLMSGALIYSRSSGSLAFGDIGLESWGGRLIFLAFGIKCAFPLLHNWLQDAYPEATVVGTVFLSAFTTKLAVYSLARGFAGTESLVWIGATMAAFPVFYAVIENDLRRVLAYSLNTQLGFMVVGIGIGTEAALNGTVAHAFACILYKALLFMSMGAVLHRTGTCKGSELGGLYRSMPWTMVFCCVGAASISAFPLFSGFVSKSLIITAAADGHYVITWFVLLFASAGVFLHSGIKIPFFAFFADDSGIRCKEAPLNMLVAMGIVAFLCVAIGVFPGPLYSLLPYEVHKNPYDTTHVVTQLQLLLFSALAFSVLMRTGIYPKEMRSTNLDFDWSYRRALPALVAACRSGGGAVYEWLSRGVVARVETFIGRLERSHGPAGIMARTWATGSSVLWVIALLFVCLIVYYI